MVLARHIAFVVTLAATLAHAEFGSNTVRSPAEQKFTSNLLQAVRAVEKAKALTPGADALPAYVQSFIDANVAADGTIFVVIKASVSSDLKAALEALGAREVATYAKFDTVSAVVPVSALRAIAERADVRTVGPREPFKIQRRAPTEQDLSDRAKALSGAVAKVGSANWNGVVAHQADKAQQAGIMGAGVKVCVISNGVDSLAGRIATGDLPPGVTVLTNGVLQNGSGDEGTAMLEIIHDMAPNAALAFATSGNSQAQFASNILALRNTLACDIIVDDVVFLGEGAFQDGPIAQSVASVTASGALYFSAAGNYGNLTQGSSSTFEGDFIQNNTPLPTAITSVDATYVGKPSHSFNGLPYAVLTGTRLTDAVSLRWADPLGGSANDYDLFVLDSTGSTILGASGGPQTGSQDPVEVAQCSGTNCAFPAGSRIYIVKYSGAARALHFSAFEGRVSGGTTGSTVGHNAQASALSVGAVDVRNFGGAFTGGPGTNVNFYSSDGPRRMFYNANGSQITPGNVLFATGGGQLFNKVDLAASDCGVTTAPGFSPFCGTSAAAPTAASIAALVKSAKPTATRAEITTALLNGGLDIGATGTERDSGAGIVMAPAAVRGVLSPLTIAKSFVPPAVTLGGTSVLTIAVTNSNAVALQGIAFTDSYPGLLVNAASPNATTTGAGCTATTSAAGSGTSFAVTLATLPAGATCTYRVTVVGNVAGVYADSGGPLNTPIALNTSGASGVLSVGSAPGGAPTAISASPGVLKVAVNFTPPASDGGLPLNFVATCAPVGGGAPVMGTGSAPPVIVAGLAAGSAYTCTVVATNAVGAGPPSGPTNNANPIDATGDVDNDGIPNGVEESAGRNPFAKDNDVFSPGAGAATLFVMQQYRDFLSREGDSAGVQGWVTAILAPTFTRPQVIDSFLSSAEFSGFVAPVVRLYFATFLRVPDYAGLTFNAGLVRNGTITVAQLADFFTQSPEFMATYGALNNTQFVTLLYNNILNRAPDTGGLNGWVQLLTTGGFTRGQVLIGFSESTEYQASSANKVFVSMMYTGMLRRTPDPGGFNGWVSGLDTSLFTRTQVINGFYLSAEYHNRFLP
jgi:Domain of unknown function (DUF4214)/Subtilase family/Fibronectin type III domain